MKKLVSFLKTELLTGFVLIAPIGGAAWFVYWLVSSIDGLFPDVFRPTVFGRPLPGLGIVVVLVLAMIAGVAAHNFAGARLARVFDEWVHRIPLFGSTYGLIKQVLEAVFSSGSGSFKEAVLVEYPTPGSWAVAFVAQKNVTGKLREAVGKDLVAVYVPTTPNPTSGFYLLVERAQVRVLDMPVETAFKLVLTMGIADAESLATTAKWSRRDLHLGKPG